MNSSSRHDTRLDPGATRLAEFVAALQAVTADRHRPEAETLDSVAAAMRRLVARDDWLDAACAVPHPEYYQQYLLHADREGRFSVVSFVWGPGQKTPVHDHGTWGVIGMLRGAEVGQGYRITEHGMAEHGPQERLQPGDVAVVSPTVGDIHVVRNAYDDRVSISIHAYGVDIGQQRRHVYDPRTGQAKAFVSGYANVARPA
jgi:3-mercaptopropionate dioxygenase